MLKNKVLLDTSFVIAVSSCSDQFHQKAKILADQLLKSETQLYTTRAVILEIGNALAKRRYRKEAIELLNSIEDDVHIVLYRLQKNYANSLFNCLKSMKIRNGD